MQMSRHTSTLQQQKDHKIPNIYWRSVSTDTLRANERYIALPPVGLLATTDGPVSHRYVRQESALWSELHDGMLTTGRLKQALGMHEPKAAQVLGIHPGSRGSSHLLSAYFHLLTTAAAAVPSSSASSSTDAATESGNEAAREQFNEQLAAAATAQTAAGGIPNIPSWMAGKSRYSGIAELQQLCEKVALAGDIPVKMYWGKVQESAALYTVLELFPAALVEEVGLFEVDLSTLPASWGIESLKHKTLPRLGASPDGILVHRVTFTQEDLQAAAARLALVQKVDQQVRLSNSTRTVAGRQEQQQQQRRQYASNSGDGALELGSSEQETVRFLLRRALDAVPCAGTKPPVGVPTADSSSSSSNSNSGDDEGASVRQIAAVADLSLPAAGTEAADEAAGAAWVSSSKQASTAGLNFQMNRLAILRELDTTTAAAPVAAGPAAGRVNYSTTAAAAAATGPTPGSLAFQPVGAAVIQLLQQYSSNTATSTTSNSSSHSHSAAGSQAAAVAIAAASPSSSSSSSSSSNGECSMLVREVVEVKNHCPFAFLAKRKGKKGRVKVSYSLRPRGPAWCVHPQWVPQLQMHMLATGCESALLVSRCPHTGVRVFRMWRDDAYLQTMLQLLQVLQTECVVPQIQPTADMYSRLPGYKAFLHKTSAIARAAVCIAVGDEEFVARVPEAADGSNVPKFW